VWGSGTKKIHLKTASKFIDKSIETVKRFHSRAASSILKDISPSKKHPIISFTH